MHLPYVGVTGFMSGHEVNRVLTPEVKAEIVRTGRQLMVGVLASAKTMAGKPLDPPWKWRYPKRSDIAGIFSESRYCLNLVHYNTKEPGLCDQLLAVQEIAGPDCDGFQLNVVLPDARELGRWRSHKASAGKRLIIQINRGVLEQCGDGPDRRTKLLLALAAYSDIATDFLFDLSGGEGRLLYVEDAVATLHDLFARFGGRYGIGAAGGIGPENLGPAGALLRKFPRLSIDAEGKLRTTPLPENAAGGDDLDTNKARAYVLAALKLIP